MKLVQIFFCRVSIKQLICVTIDKVTHTSKTKTGFAFLAKNQCIQHGMCRGQCKNSSFEYKSQSFICLGMTKDHAKSFNKIGFSKKKVSPLTQTKEEILVFCSEGDISICQNLWLSRNIISQHSVPSRDLREQGHNT